MIPSKAIKDYLARSLDSHVWVKQLDREQLLEEVRKLKPRPRLYKDILQHQLACFLLGVAYPQFAFWLDMGTGKTLLALELLKYWHQCGKVRKALIFVTSDKAFPTWEKQIKRYNIDLPYVVLEGPSTTKWQQLAELEEGLIIVAYPGATALVTKINYAGAKHKWKLDTKLVSKLAEGVDAIVLDESTRVGHHQSLIHKIVAELTDTVKIRYALAGRPFGRDPTLLWAQHMLIDGGETLGPTLGLFREAFFRSKPNEWVNSPFSKVPKWKRKYAIDYTFDKKKMPQLSRMVQHRSVTYAADECIDLPDFIPIIEEVPFPEEAVAYYHKAVRAIIDSKRDWRVVKNVFLRMRQIASGFIGFKNDETGEKAEVEFEENPKLDRLLELLEDMPYDRKAVVFYEYTVSGKKIFAEVKKLKLKPIWLWSGTKDYKAQMASFEKDPACRVAVLQNKVGAFSLDGLQVANYAFFYESPVSVIDREQAERRLRRQGQQHKVFQYDLIVKNSIEAKILAFHKEGGDLLDALRRDPGKVL